MAVGTVDAQYGSNLTGGRAMEIEVSLMLIGAYFFFTGNGSRTSDISHLRVSSDAWWQSGVTDSFVRVLPPHVSRMRRVQSNV